MFWQKSKLEDRLSKKSGSFGVGKDLLIDSGKLFMSFTTPENGDGSQSFPFFVNFLLIQSVLVQFINSTQVCVMSIFKDRSYTLPIEK